MATPLGATVAAAGGDEAVRLRRLEEERRLLLDAVADGIIGLDDVGTITFANASAGRLLGVEPSALLDEGFSSRVPHRYEGGPCPRGTGCRFSGGAGDSAGRGVFTRADGRLLEVEFTVRTLRRGDGTAGAVVTFRDIGARVRVETELEQQKALLADAVAARSAELRTAERRLAIATRVGGLGIWEIHPRVGMRFADARTLDLLGADAADLERLGNLWQSRIHDEDRTAVLARLEQCYRSDGTVFDIDYRYHHPLRGALRLRSVACVIERDAGGDPLRMVGYLEDVTDRHRLQEELRRAKEEAESASRSKSIFLASISHEIRTPLNAVLGYAQLLARDQALGGTALERVRRILSGGEHLLALLNDVLDLARIEAGRVEVQPCDCDLLPLLDEIHDLFRPVAESKGLSFALRRDGALPRRVRIDAGKVRQVVLNLIGNACKFTAAGGVCVTIAAEHDGARHQVSIAVADTGPGIEASECERLFEDFARAGAASRSAPGSGLGLPLSRRLAALIGGRLTVASTPGCGSTFTFVFPAAPAAGDGDLSAIRRRIPTVSAAQERPAGERVLVVDDEPCNRDILAVLLEQEGYAVRCAADGGTALQLWTDWSPQLVLMDQRLPDLDGLEVVRRLQGQPGGALVPMVLVTANAFESNRRAALAEGAIDAFVRKPYRAEEILTTVARLLGRPAAPPLPKPAEDVTAATAQPALELPAAMLAELRTAIATCRLYDLLGILDRLASTHPQTAARLRALAESFRYGDLDAILAEAVAGS